MGQHFLWKRHRQGTVAGIRDSLVEKVIRFEGPVELSSSRSERGGAGRM